MPEVVSAALFTVEIPGILHTDSQFFHVSALVSESAVMETRSGRDEFSRKTPGRNGTGDVTLRRHYDGNDALHTWRRNIERGIIDRRSGTVRILGTDRQTIVAEFNFHEAWPRRWSLGPWEAEDDRPLVEEVVLSVRTIERVTG